MIKSDNDAIEVRNPKMVKRHVAQLTVVTYSGSMADDDRFKFVGKIRGDQLDQYNGNYYIIVETPSETLLARLYNRSEWNGFDVPLIVLI